MYMLLSANVDAGKDLYKLRKVSATATNTFGSTTQAHNHRNKYRCSWD